jgi:hypothetical protein
MARSRAEVAAAAMRFTVSSMAAGPWLQLAPMTGTPISSRAATTASGDSP